MKLLSFLQSLGIARRTLTKLIQQQEIIVNGHVVDNFLMICQPGDQYIITSLGIAGTVPQFSDKTSSLILFYKPVGYTVSKLDTHNDTIYDILPSDRKSKYYPIGRLDKDSCGLLLLTDNAQRVNQLSHPRYQHNKVYHVLLKQSWKSQDTQKVLNGITIYDDKSDQNIVLKCDHVTAIEGGVAITLHEGKNRHIRKMLGGLGYDIVELKRVSFCGVQLGEMQEGEYHLYHLASLESLAKIGTQKR